MSRRAAAPMDAVVLRRQHPESYGRHHCHPHALMTRTNPNPRPFRPTVTEALETRTLLSTLPWPLLQADVGAAAGGASTYRSGVFAVSGAGGSVSGASDAGHFVYR